MAMYNKDYTLLEVVRLVRMVLVSLTLKKEEEEEEAAAVGDKVEEEEAIVSSGDTVMNQTVDTDMDMDMEEEEVVDTLEVMT